MNTVFTNQDLIDLRRHLLEKVEHGWTTYKLEGLIYRLEEAEKICEYAKKMGLNVRGWMIAKGSIKEN